jgi:hypothetical protein
MVYNGIYSAEKNAEKFICESCSFQCSKKSDWDRHVSTRKHKNGIQMVYNDTSFYADGNNLASGVKKRQKNATSIMSCKCGKKYVYKSGYYRHKKICSMNEENYIDDNNELVDMSSGSHDEFKEMVAMLLKENKEIQKTFVDMLPYMKGGNMNSNNNIINNTTNNNQFNINMFLNEHCKNAMNLTEFINTLPITNETYDNTIENGLTKTITSMVVNGLNNMDILKRPIHCTDPARKIMYIKDNDVWEKDNELLLLLHGIKSLSLKQRTSLNKWQEANIGWDKDEDLQTKMTKLVFHSMTNLEDDEKEVSKIVRAISKSTYLSQDIKENYK